MNAADLDNAAVRRMKSPSASQRVLAQSGAARVYLAGKIRKNCWRHQLVPGLREGSWKEHTLSCKGFMYVGPFFVGCDHGCYHRPGSHGSGAGCWPDRDVSVMAIPDLCREAIRRADLVFCYIDAKDCYGTLVELGQAFAFRVPVVIALSKTIRTSPKNEFWLACEQAKRVHLGVSESQLPALLRSAIAGGAR